MHGLGVVLGENMSIVDGVIVVMGPKRFPYVFQIE